MLHGLLESIHTFLPQLNIGPVDLGDLPASLGFEWGLCPILLSFKFTFNMFLFSAPLAHWGLLFGSLKFAA